jgi:hypothetical protein
MIQLPSDLPDPTDRQVLINILAKAKIEVSEIEGQFAVIDKGHPIYFEFNNDGSLKAIRRGE